MRSTKLVVASIALAAAPATPQPSSAPPAGPSSGPGVAAPDTGRAVPDTGPAKPDTGQATSDTGQPKPDTGHALSDADRAALAALGWPATTRSVRAVRGTDVSVGMRGYNHAGRIAAGSRLDWKRIELARGEVCRAYIELVPRGWVCARDFAPSDEPPIPAEAADPDQVLALTLATPHIHAVPEGATAFQTPARGPGAKLPGWTPLLGPVTGLDVVNDKLYVKTIAGYVAARELMARPVSEYAGTQVTAATPWPFAWVVPSAAGERGIADVRGEPSVKGPALRTVAARTIVPVLETRDRFARIADGAWVALADLRVARSSVRPEGVRADERWLDVDLDEEVLVAYAGDTPVYATIVSTGFGGATPTSLHRIAQKRALMTLVSPKTALGEWNIPDVPFVMMFRKYYAVHGAYWHDGFGSRRGHGCVNVSPRDGRFLYGWTLPEVPAGWSEAEAVGDRGTPIRIRNREVPNPKWTSYDAEPPVKQKDPGATE